MALRLAQMFDVSGSFVPTKASLCFKRVGTNIATYHPLDSGDVPIDATNFNTLIQGENNKAIIDDIVSGYTNNGYMRIDGSYHYYIKALEPIVYYRLGDPDISLVAIDEMENHDGIYVNNPILVEGLTGDPSNKAKQFNPVLGQQITTSGCTEFGGAVSVICRASFNPPPPGVSVGAGDPTSSFFVANWNGTIVANVLSYGGIQSSINVNDGQPHTIAATWNPVGAGSLKIYIDGVEDIAATVILPGFFAGPWPQLGVHVFDEMAFFDKALTADQIAAIHSKYIEVPNWGILSYNVRTDTPSKFYLYLRGWSSTGIFKVSILIDGFVVNTINSVALSAWSWFATDFVLPDDKEHILGIRLEENSNLLDKIEIKSSGIPPIGDGADVSLSPFVTIHLQIYDLKNLEPDNPLFIYDWKTTISEVRIDDWYNFTIQYLDGPSLGFDESYALVLSASGGSSDNYVIWELIDNEEYLLLPSSVKV